VSRGLGRVTLHDVAREAGVSTATVSLVVNGKTRSRISSATEERVRSAIEQLNYHVDTLARGLATGRRQCVALMAPHVANPFFTDVMRGVSKAFGPEYQVLIVMASGDEELSTRDLERTLDLRVDGLLVDSPGAALFTNLHVDVPIVVLDDPSSRGAHPRVSFDLASGARMLADHLVGLGHSRVVYVDSLVQLPTFAARRAAFLRRMRFHLKGRFAYTVHKTHLDPDHAADVFTSTIAPAVGPECTVVVCATDVQAYGVLAAAEQSGIRIPTDLSVASFDDLKFSRLVRPTLTTVKLPPLELGYASGRMLQSLIEGEQVSSPVTIPVSLQVRESTGGVPAYSGSRAAFS
jgi:LacI family transcriptional regulator